jgi:hypothetical protein
VRVIDKYLGRYAEPEQRIAQRLDGCWKHALVVPAFDERIALLDGLAVCASAEALVILVVNARDDHDPRALGANAELLAALPGELVSTQPPAWLARRAGVELLVIDRTSIGFRLPAKQGVGLARRIGADLALALWRHGKLISPWIGSTDADAELPLDYFAAQSASPAAAVALTYPFVHVPSGEALLDRATELYERWLQHYVDGLRRARSRYAFHSVGSALAVHAEAYAGVRGFPRRQAGEDFHLLDKLAKIGDIAPASAAPIRIRARRSSRVPFGTGPAVRRYEALLAEGKEPSFYHPESFERLAVWLSALDAFAEHRNPQQLMAVVDAHPPLRTALDSLGAIDAALAEREQAPDAVRLRRRLHTSFGALQTLRLIHALGDAGLPPLPWTRSVSPAGYSRVVHA